MRILLVNFCKLSKEDLGGVGVAVMQLANSFRARNSSSAVVQMGDKWRPQAVLPDQIPTWCIAGPSFPTIRRPRSWASFVRSALQLERILYAFKPDIVNVHFPVNQSLPVVAAASLHHRWRLVVTLHNSDIRLSPFLEPRLRIWQRRLMDCADAVTAVSAALLEDAIRLYPSIAKKGYVIHNGIEDRWFDSGPVASQESAKYVLSVGRLHEMKGLDILLRAWSKICSQLPTRQLWLVGEGPEESNLRKLVQELGISASVRFLGKKNFAELIPLYRNAELFILSSRREGFPFTLLEASASGTLCVAAGIPGIGELIEDQATGFLVAPENPEELASTMLRALQLDSIVKERIIEAAKRKVQEHFTEDRMAMGYLNLFGSLK